MPRLAHTVRRLRLFACLAVLGCSTILVAQTQWSDNPFEDDGSFHTPGTRSSESEPVAKPERLREGMHLIEVIGHFEMPAEGLIFVDDAGRRLTGLENLNLQRIARHLRGADRVANVPWKVTGTVTEYEGRNYILIERAVYQPPRL